MPITNAPQSNTPKPPYVLLYLDRVEICGEGQSKLTVTAESVPEALETYAKTYARILGVPLTDKRK